MKLFFAGLCSLLLACNGNSDKEASTALVAGKNETVKKTSSSIKIRNDIQLEAKGLKVNQAFLLYEDDGKLVPESNTTAVGKPVDLRLIIDGGWVEKDGQVSLGASERIESSEGDVLLDEKDLFKHITTVRPEDAKYITLTANISKMNKLFDYFLVSFRVWDKNGNGEITGSYKLHIE